MNIECIESPKGLRFFKSKERQACQYKTVQYQLHLVSLADELSSTHAFSLECLDGHRCVLVHTLESVRGEKRRKEAVSMSAHNHKSITIDE